MHLSCLSLAVVLRPQVSISHIRRGPKAAVTGFTGGKCALEAPHTCDTALVLVLTSCVHSFSSHLLSISNIQGPSLPLCGHRAHRSAPLPISGLILALDVLRLYKLDGTFTSSCLCSGCSLYMQRPPLWQSSTLSTTHRSQYLPWCHTPP